MPLPPAPTKPASRLTPEAMATTARKPANRTRRATPTGDDATTISALPPPLASFHKWPKWRSQAPKAQLQPHPHLCVPRRAKPSLHPRWP